jgi:hypothetical protein
MVLCRTLVDADIPHCDKMREAIINHWKKSFEELKMELSISLHFLSLLYLTLINRNPAEKSVSQWTFGQTGIWWHF